MRILIATQQVRKCHVFLRQNSVSQFSYVKTQSASGALAVKATLRYIVTKLLLLTAIVQMQFAYLSEGQIYS